MSRSSAATTTANAPHPQPIEGAKPRLRVFTIREREGAKGFWVEIGSAFVNRDGSFTVLLDALPVNGRLHIRAQGPRDEEQGQGQQG